MPHTFASLAALGKAELDRIMDAGTAPAIADVLGWEFRGWNVNAMTKLFGTRKFKKGFFGNPAFAHAWGYNVPVQQNKFDEPWIAKPSDADPNRYFFYGVVTAADADQPKYRNSLVVDYRKWDYFVLNPVGYTVDYLVYPEPGNTDLILGKSYGETPLIKPFLGYFILERHNRSNYPRTSKFLSDEELETVRAFAEAFFEGPDVKLTPEAIMWNVDRHLERIRSNRTKSLKLLLHLIESVIPRRVFPFFRPRFSKMKVEERRAFIRDTLATPKNHGLLRDFAKIRTLITAGYYLDPSVHPSIGFVPVEQRPKFAGKLVARRPDRLPTTVPTGGSVTVDTCVIGSGAGGAVVAARRAAAGRSVALLEEGPYVATTLAEMVHDEGVMTTLLFKEGGLQSTVDLDTTVLQGKCLGGSTTINNAICFALLNDPNVSAGAPDVLADWRAFGADLDVERLRSSYRTVSREINVGAYADIQEPGVGSIVGENGRVLLQGWQELVRRDPGLARWTSGEMRKNYDGCLGCGYCNFGCRYGRKMSMLEVYIPMAIAAGATVYTACHAVRIATAGRRATSVVCEVAGGRTFTVHAQEVVVACGAIGSSMLLAKSGVTRNVGSRFSFNAGSPLFARFPRAINAFDGLQIATFVDHGDFLLESLFYPPLSFSAALPGWFRTHFDRMRAMPRFACAGVLVGTAPNGRVKSHSLLNGLTGPIEWSMNATDLGKMVSGLARLAQVFFAAGAEELLPSTFADVRLTAAEHGRKGHDELRAVLAAAVTRPEDLTLSSAHPQGGNPMSDDPTRGVVDSGFRVHGYDNLYVCDASVFPTSARINPQLTVMAVADYFGGL